MKVGLGYRVFDDHDSADRLVSGWALIIGSCSINKKEGKRLVLLLPIIAD